jgi:hypothetical protein
MSCHVVERTKAYEAASSVGKISHPTESSVHSYSSENLISSTAEFNLNNKCHSCLYICLINYIICAVAKQANNINSNMTLNFSSVSQYVYVCICIYAYICIYKHISSQAIKYLVV